MIGIYRVTCTDTGLSYIGQSTDIKGRWSQHKSDLKRGFHNNRQLQYDWNHFRDSFEFVILVECDELDLDSMEDYYIKRFSPNIYNVRKVTGSAQSIITSETDGYQIRWIRAMQQAKEWIERYPPLYFPLPE